MPYHLTKDACELINKGPLMIQQGCSFELSYQSQENGPLVMVPQEC